MNSTAMVPYQNTEMNLVLRNGQSISKSIEANFELSLRILPNEVKVVILDYLILQKAPCLNGIFGDCFDEWSCKEHHYQVDNPSYTLPVTLDPKLACLGRFFHDALMSFFKNNTFLFDSRGLRGNLLNQAIETALTNGNVLTEDDTEAFAKFRDPRATRLLDFIDRPSWKGVGAETFADDESYKNVDNYRYRMQHIIFDLRYNIKLMSSYRPDWDWPLKIAYSTLPRLKTLVLDLRAYSAQYLLSLPYTQEEFDHKIRSGAKLMSCLNLRTLTLVGLCSGPKFFGNADHKMRIQHLFKSAMHKDGEIVFKDWMYFLDW